MNEGKKVWIIVYRVKGSTVELLALKPNPEPGLNYDYYVITGGVEENENPTEAAFRETYEEIGIKPRSVTSLNKSIAYVDKSSEKTFIEECFAAKIGDETIVLNEEHIGYAWLSIDEFKKTIWWLDMEEKLDDILQSFIKIAVH